jgi:hypothetical protein
MRVCMTLSLIVGLLQLVYIRGQVVEMCRDGV